MGAPTMDDAACAARMRCLYETWRAERDGAFGGASALVVGTGANKEDDLRYLKAVALEVWLFSYELPDTLLMFTERGMHVVAGGKKAALMENAREVLKEECGLDLAVHVKPKGEDGAAQAAAVVEAIKSENLVVGMVMKEKNEGAMMQYVTKALGEAGMEIKDVTSGVSLAMAAKDEKELGFVNKAVTLTSKALGFAVKEMEATIEDEKKLTHAKLSEMTEDAIIDPSRLGLKFPPEDVDICYPPIFQSGGEYDLKYSAESANTKLHYASPPAVVHMSVGARYTQYCANVGRTYMVDPTPAQEATYAAILAAQEAGIAALVDGATCASVYEAVKSSLTSAEGVDGATLASKLNKNVGTAMGLEFRDMTFVLNGKCETKIKAGMLFNLAVGVQGLKEPSAKEGSKNETYAVMIADSVLVGAAGETPSVLTTNPKGVKEISYIMNDDDDDRRRRRSRGPNQTRGRHHGCEDSRRAIRSELGGGSRASSARVGGQKECRNVQAIDASGRRRDSKRHYGLIRRICRVQVHA